MNITAPVFKEAQWQQMRAQATLSVNIFIQKNHQMQFVIEHVTIVPKNVWHLFCQWSAIISLVLCYHSKNLKQQTDHCYSSMLQLSLIWPSREENTSSRHECGLTQKIHREAPSSNFGSLFLYFFFFFFSPEPALYKIGLARRLFVFPEVPTTDLGPSFVLFSWAFPVFVF